MSSRNSVAASVRAAKEANPEHFCRVKSCLWRIKTPRGDSPCQKHPLPSPSPIAPAPTTPKACACPYLLQSVARHVPTCQQFDAAWMR